MAITEVYVDPAINANTGSGTIGDPYGDLQYALNTKTRDATNGDRFNVKAGTAEVLTATLSFTTYGTPTQAAPCVIQGYTATAGDGGIGEISGNATYKIVALLEHTIFRNMKLGNVGNNDILTGGASTTIDSCEIYGATKTSSNAMGMGNYSNVVNCYIHDIEATMLNIGTGGKVLFNVLDDNAATCIAAISHGSYGITICFNIVSVCSTAKGIVLAGNTTFAAGNSIFAAGSNQMGIDAQNGEGMVIVNNIIEGFSASGGIGIKNGTASQKNLQGCNGFYNNATGISGTYVSLGGDVTYSASPFVDAANMDFRLKPGTRGGGFPNPFKGQSISNYLDLGAMQAIQSMRRSRAILIG